MTTRAASSPCHHPMLGQEEIDALAARYGQPVLRSHTVYADDYLRRLRVARESDRRGEVIFVIQDPAGRIWVHTKAHYPSHIYRLFSGGIQWHETVEEALWREVAEETGLPCTIERFMGLLAYCFQADGRRGAVCQLHLPPAYGLLAAGLHRVRRGRGLPDHLTQPTAGFEQRFAQPDRRPPRLGAMACSGDGSGVGAIGGRNLTASARISGIPRLIA